MASDDGRRIGVERRGERLAAALRENLKRRKAQQRGRNGAAAGSPGGEAPAEAAGGPPGNRQA
jgi:hypothetical protein